VYDPSTGRFASEDPLRFLTGPNAYIYCANDPINWIDPFGLWGQPWEPAPEPDPGVYFPPCHSSGTFRDVLRAVLRFFTGLTPVSSSDPFYPLTPQTVLDQMTNTVPALHQRTGIINQILDEYDDELAPLQ
jgi:hypothetical protein